MSTLGQPGPIRYSSSLQSAWTQLGLLFRANLEYDDGSAENRTLGLLRLFYMYSNNAVRCRLDNVAAAHRIRWWATMKIVLCLLAASSLLFAQSDRALSGLENRYGTAQLRAMKTDDQIATLQRRLKEKPDNLQDQGMLAAVFLQKLRETMDPVYLQRSASLVDKMLSATPSNYLALRLQNEIDMQRHDFPKVIQRSRILLTQNPSDAGTVGLLGDALMEQGRYDEAGNEYHRMLELSPNLSSYNRVAYHSYVTGKTAEAISWMYQAVRAGSDSPENQAWCLVEFGDLLFKSGRVADAESAYAQALQKFPTYHRAFAAAGRLSAAKGDYPRAIALLLKAQSSVPLPEYAATLEAVYRLSGNVQDADRQLQLIDTIDKLMQANGETMNRNLAVIFADESRKLDRALDLAQAEFKVRNDVFTYDALSWVQFKRKRYAEAAAASEIAMKLGTADPMLYYHAGMIRLACSDKERARRDLEQALSLNPNFDFRYAAEARRTLQSLSGN